MMNISKDDFLNFTKGILRSFVLKKLSNNIVFGIIYSGIRYTKDKKFEKYVEDLKKNVNILKDEVKNLRKQVEDFKKQKIIVDKPKLITNGYDKPCCNLGGIYGGDLEILGGCINIGI